jgi:hypothetical protein
MAVKAIENAGDETPSNEKHNPDIIQFVPKFGYRG